LDEIDDDLIDMDDGPTKALPSRLCVVSRQTYPVNCLIRFVASPDGMLTPDIKRKLPGRGVWVEAKKETLELALKRKSFARSLKMPVTIPDDLTGLVERLLTLDALQAFSIANKAGKVVAGQSKVESEIAKSAVIAIIHATDAAQDSIRKLGQAVKRRFGAEYEGSKQFIVISPFQSSQMSLCLGKEHVIHTCLINDATSKLCLEKCQLLMGYRGELKFDKLRIGELDNNLPHVALNESISETFASPSNEPKIFDVDMS
jgi:uncharacterized protein